MSSEGSKPRKEKRQNRQDKFRAKKNAETEAARKDELDQDQQPPPPKPGQRRDNTARDKVRAQQTESAAAKAATKPTLNKTDAWFSAKFDASEWVDDTKQTLTIDVNVGLHLAILLTAPDAITKLTDYEPSAHIMQGFAFEYATRAIEDFWTGKKTNSPEYVDAVKVELPWSRFNFSLLSSLNGFEVGLTRVKERRIRDTDCDQFIAPAAGTVVSLGKYLSVVPDMKLWLFLVYHQEELENYDSANPPAMPRGAAAAAHLKKLAVLEAIYRRINQVLGTAYTGFTLDEVSTAIVKLRPNYRDQHIFRMLVDYYGVKPAIQIARVWNWTPWGPSLGADDFQTLSDTIDIVKNNLIGEVKYASIRQICDDPRSGATLLRPLTSQQPAVVLDASLLVNRQRYLSDVLESTVGPNDDAPNLFAIVVAICTFKYDLFPDQDALIDLRLTQRRCLKTITKQRRASLEKIFKILRNAQD